MSTASPFKIRPHLITAAGKSITVWGETDKLEVFLSNIEPTINTPAAARTIQVKQHRVVRYPGDTGYSRRAHQRIYTADQGFSGGITPGRNFWIEEEVLTDTLAEAEFKGYQFTHTGPFYVLKAFCVANATQPFRLRSSGGRAHLIDPD